MRMKFFRSLLKELELELELELKLKAKRNFHGFI